ncbi:MAG TPA: hypothetical protein VKA27_00750 [Sunxiuqinia sp.]|nr:hypothetical protein [Sunxiuqinia sp.]
MIGKFFHTPKARNFNIPYRFHDPQKEEMKDREERIKMELGMHEKKEFDANYRANLHGQFRRSMGAHSKSTTDARYKSNTRLITLIIVLAIAAYLIFKF